MLLNFNNSLGSVLALMAKRLLKRLGVEYCIMSFVIFRMYYKLLWKKRKATLLSVGRCEFWLTELFLIFIYGIFLAKKMGICSHCATLIDQ